MQLAKKRIYQTKNNHEKSLKTARVKTKTKTKNSTWTESNKQWPDNTAEND